MNSAVDGLGIPNLFEYATHELSQDAALCWLLAWANPELKSTNKPMHEIGFALLKAILEKEGSSELLNDLTKLQVIRQWNNIDILVRMNGRHTKHALIIEDKIGSGAHSNQLQRYRELILRDGYDESQIHCVYLKTMDQTDYVHAFNDGYVPFVRGDMLEVLRHFKDTDNAIFSDFLRRLESIESLVKTYLRIPVDRWGHELPAISWTGFFSALKHAMPEITWSRVNNVAGGYWGATWHWQHQGPFVHIRENQLAICLNASGIEDRQGFKYRWHRLALDTGQKTGIELRKPYRMRIGETMTIAESVADYRHVDQSGIIDIESTVRFLKRFSTLIDEMNNQIKV